MNTDINSDESDTLHTIEPFMVALEQTRYLSEEARALTGRFWTLYVYDKNLNTHCCEITPSYWLQAYDFVTEKRLSENVPAQANLYDAFMSELYDDSHYYHCSFIDAMEAEGMAQAILNYDGTSRDYENMDRVVEDLQANHDEPKGLTAILPSYEDDEE